MQAGTSSARLDSPRRCGGQRRFAASFAAAVLLLAVAAAPLAAQDDPRQAADGASALFLQHGAVAVVGASGGAAQALPSLPGSYFRTVEALADGWLVTGAIESAAGRELLLLRQREGKIESLSPPRGEGRLRGNAIALLDAGRLAGLAWLEGDRFDRLGVFAAVWDGTGWGEPEKVAPGLDSQVALAGAALADGSWLLAWSAFDGEDDETVWSLRREGRWGAPQRLHEDNKVPDITPALIATDAGALVAWSWFDGNDYRMRGARFDGADWTLSEPFGARGSLEPGFTAWDGVARLLYQTVAPATWAVVEYDRAGIAVRRGEAPEPAMVRPLLTVAGARADAALVWPGGENDESREVALSWEPIP